MIRDPVCLMTVHPSHAVAMLDFGGRSYYFCSEDCRDPHLPDIIKSFSKDTGSHIIYDADPASLVSRLLAYYETKQFKKPSCFCSERAEATG